MVYDCVLVDCSGSMAAIGKSGNTRTQETLDMLFDMLRGQGQFAHPTPLQIDRKTLIIPFDSAPRGGITMDLLEQMSRAEVEKIFAPRGSTNIPLAIHFGGSTNILVLTDDPASVNKATSSLGTSLQDVFPIVDIS